MRRLLLVQYGDYLTAMLDRQEERPETYRSQYHSLEVVDQGLDGGECLVVCLDAGPYDERQGPYRLVADRFEPRGRGPFYDWQAAASVRRITALAREFAPTHAVIRTPGWALTGVGLWARNQGIPVLPLLADYFDTSTRASRRRTRAAVELINSLPLAGNHNYPACRSMVRAGVDPSRVVPWDWPSARHPASSPVKRRGKGPLRLVYAGLLLESKGVGDLIQGVSLHREREPEMVLDVFGQGPHGPRLRSLVRDMGLQDSVRFHGSVANQEVLAAMNRAACVVVPSRPEYAEGMPGVVYEAFESRTPVVCSSHPSFAGLLREGRGCAVFEAKDPLDLSRALDRAVSDADTYAGLSATTLQAWMALRCPVTFADLVLGWLDATEEQAGPVLSGLTLAEVNGDAP